MDKDKRRQLAKMQEHLAEQIREAGILFLVFGPLDLAVQWYADHADPTKLQTVGQLYVLPGLGAIALGLILLGLGVYLGRNDE